MNKKVLVIDDEKSIVQSLEAGLANKGYEVFTHNCGKGVLEKIKKHSPHLVILDIKLPERNG
ncbi:MAG: response regulator, partial [archaeon]